MSSFAKEVVIANLEEEMRRSYLDYAMSVIVGRALPDVADGLKPVHRRILYAMHELNNDWNKPYKKSARVTGDVIGKYHPHGDTAIYDAIVRMAQPFSLRYPLIDGQGNFGSVDGDSPAAMRYTEIRLSKIAHELLADIEKETVDYVPNYDESELQPVVLPTKLPNLLMNGSDGIAVGMATRIPPHNLAEIIAACFAYIDDESISIAELMEHIPGPDFPTAGIINGKQGIRQAYHTGRGSLKLRARTVVETATNGKESIIIEELPYQVNKALLVEKIAALSKDKVIEGITHLRDESDKSGMRVVIEINSDFDPQMVLNNLYAKTKMENAYHINLVALSNNQPKTFNLKELIAEFVQHRREVTRRRLLFELKKARQRAQVLEGFAVALGNLDVVIELIRSSKNRQEARERLMVGTWDTGILMQLLEGDADLLTDGDKHPGFGITQNGYKLTKFQANSILDLRLHRLTGLEQEKILEEFKSVLANIRHNLHLLSSPADFMQVIRDELNDVLNRFGKNDERRTDIIEEQLTLSDEDFIVPEDVMVTVSHAGYVKRQPLSEYRAQHRGGKGKKAGSLKDGDYIDSVFIANTHNTLLCFTNFGQLFWLKVYQLPSASRTARGKPLVNWLQLREGEKVTAVLPISEFNDSQYVVMSTRQGRIKKCPLMSFSNRRVNGIRAVSLWQDDELVNVGLTHGDYDILLISDAGRAVRFDENQVRPMGRTAAGVKGMNLSADDEVISMILLPDDSEDRIALFVSNDGYGKRTRVNEIPAKSRGTKGVYVLPQKKRQSAKMLRAFLVAEGDGLFLITDRGTLIHTKVDKISLIGRATAGVRLMTVNEDENLVGAAIVMDDDTQENGEGTESREVD